MQSSKLSLTANARRLALFKFTYALLLTANFILFSGTNFARAEQSVNLAWDPSPSAGVAGYTVRYGTTSGNYSDFLVAGLNTTATVPDLVEGTTYYFVVTAYTLSGLESDPSNELRYTVPNGTPSSNPPTVDAVANVTIAEDAPEQTIILSGITVGPGGVINQLGLSISASSSNPALIPNPIVNYSSPGQTGALRFTPVANVSGTAIITVTVDNHQLLNNLVSRSFAVTVSPVNDTPTLDAISHLTLATNAGLQTVLLTGISTGAADESQTLTVTATSSNPGLILDPIVTYASSDPTGILTFTPLANASGTATITVRVDDGQTQDNAVVKSFNVTIGSPSVSTLFLEAESGVLISPMTKASDTEASGEEFVYSPNAFSGTLSLPFNIAVDGDYIVWCRVLSRDANSDSFFVSIDGVLTAPYFTASNGVSSAWQWSQLNGINFGNPRVFTLSAGNHTLLFRCREPNTFIDSIYITNDRNFVPPGSETNNPPTLASISNLTLQDQLDPVEINLTGISSGSANEDQPLTVTATSSNPELVLNPIVIYSSPNDTGTLTLTVAPNANSNGTATITVTVDDGQSSNNLTTRTFDVTINNTASAPLAFYLEAEAGDLTNPMIIAASDDASNGGYVYSPSNDKGAVTFNFHGAEPGNYVIWCRILSANSSTDSFYVSVDGQSEDIYRTAQNTWSPSWQWSRINNEADPNAPLTFSLSTGDHTLRLRARESATLLDAVYITKNQDFIPIKLAIRRVTNPSRGVHLSFQSVAGYGYSIEATENMHLWTTIWSTAITPTSQVFSHLDTSSTTSGKRFYRVKIER